MKKLFLLLCLYIPFTAQTQHTFSIVAVDSITGEIGSAGATCLFFKDAALDISDVVLGVGAIHTQAWWDPDNQSTAHDRMVAGDNPQEIITWMKNNDVGDFGATIEDRQYGVVTLNDGHPQSAAFTGDNNEPQKGHRVGRGYSIQGNILISQDVLNDMEDAYLASTGSLAKKLMAVMQAAKRPGADSRCLDEGWSSGSAFIRVAKPSDTDSSFGNLWLDISLYTDSGEFNGDPIDEMQKRFDAFIEETNTDDQVIDDIKIYPSPSNGIVNIINPNPSITTIEIVTTNGQKLGNYPLTQKHETIDIRHLNDGVYFINFYFGDYKQTTKKVVLYK